MASPVPAKRKERPCDSCRKRKSRCVVEEGSGACVLCKFHAQACTFVETPLSRKRRAPEDLEVSERRLSESLGSPRSAFGDYKRVIRTINGTGVEEYDDLDGPTLLKKTLGLQNQHHSQLVGQTTGLEPRLTGPLAAAGGEIPLTHCTLRWVSDQHVFSLLPDLDTQGYSEELDDSDSIEAIIAPHGKALVDIYFRIVFPSFPILHKEVYLEKYGRSYKEFSPPLLAAVYLLALHYWSYDDRLSQLSKPDMPKLERLARKALRDTVHRPKLSTVQAGLLLLQHSDTDSAELTAQLVSVAYGLGLHLDASHWEIPGWEKGLRKRLGWALYMQDKWSALGSGRPPLIGFSNWSLRPVTNADFPENAEHENDQEGSSEVEQGRLVFIRMISLSEILADMLDSLFSAKFSESVSAAGLDSLEMILEHAKPVQIRLKEWFSSLPECLSMSFTQVMKLSSVGYLRLAYFAAEITLHRRILLAISPSTDPQFANFCSMAAHTRFVSAVDFVQTLKPQHLSSFWYFASSKNFSLISVFGVLLCASARNASDRQFYASKLKEYRWTLKINSENGARYMRPAIMLLDENLSLLAQADSRTQALPQPKTNLSSEPPKYDLLLTQVSVENGEIGMTPSVSSVTELSYETPYAVHQEWEPRMADVFSHMEFNSYHDLRFDLGGDLAEFHAG